MTDKPDNTIHRQGRDGKTAAFLRTEDRTGYVDSRHPAGSQTIWSRNDRTGPMFLARDPRPMHVEQA